MNIDIGRGDRMNPKDANMNYGAQLRDIRPNRNAVISEIKDNGSLVISIECKDEDKKNSYRV